MRITRRSVLLATAAAMTVPVDIARAFTLHGGAASGGSPPGTLGTLTLQSISGSNITAGQPFEFGLPIAPATMSPTQKLVLTDAASNVLTVQEDNRVIDADGYVRWVMGTAVAASAPGASSTNITMSNTTGSPNTSNPITLANLLAQTISGDTFECKSTITLPNGTVYTAKATDGLNASTTWTYGSPFFQGIWRQGPLCTEFVVLVPYSNAGTPHPYLYCEFHIAAYKANPGPWDNVTNPITGVRVYCFNENGFNGNISGWTGAPQDYAYDWQIQMGASTLSTALLLNGNGVQSTTLSLNALSGAGITCTGPAATFALNTTTPNSSDCGKALVELSGSATGIAYINQYTSGTSAYLTAPSTTPFSSTSVTSWKKMGVYHYFGSRVSNTAPSIGGSWWGTNGTVLYPMLNQAYLQGSQMVPNYRLTSANVVAPDLTDCNADGAHPCGMSVITSGGRIKNYLTQEGQTGEVPQIGVLPFEQAQSILYWGDSVNHANARTLLLYNAEVGHRKPFWFRNEQYGQVNHLTDAGCYGYTGSGAEDGAATQINNFTKGSSWFSWSPYHSGQTSYVPYLLTGDYYHLQNLYLLSTEYPMQYSGAGVFDTTSLAVTVSGSNITITGSGNDLQTGDGVTLAAPGGNRPFIGGSVISQLNHYYWRSTGTKTGNLYTSWAQAQAGGSTGLITFSTSGTGVYIKNGYTKQAVDFFGQTQARMEAWNLRSAGQIVALWPDSPISPNIMFPNGAKSNLRRNFAGFMSAFNTAFTASSWYLAGLNPRMLTVQGGTEPPWENNYAKHAASQLVEAGVQSAGASASNLSSFLDWDLADQIEWHVQSTVPPAFYNTGYYICVNTNVVNGGQPQNNTYQGIFNCHVGAPLTGGYNGGNNLNTIWPTNITATIGSIADPSNVTVTLSGNWFDTSQKTAYEGIAWFMSCAFSGGPYSSRRPNGIGRIKTIVSASQIIVDFTVTSAYTQQMGSGFTGSISGGVLTISAWTYGGNNPIVFAAGDTLTDGGVNIPLGTTIVSGSGNTWTLSNASLNVSSQAMHTIVVPPTGSGLYVGLPYPPLSVFYTNVSPNDISYTFSPAQGATCDVVYAILERGMLEMAKQRGINSANYSAAVAEMTGRNFPTTWTGVSAGGSGFQAPAMLKFNLLSRV